MYLSRQFFYSAILFLGFTIFFCYVFLSSLRAIVAASKKLHEALLNSKNAFASTAILTPTPSPTQFGQLLLLFQPTPTIIARAEPSPVSARASQVVAENVHPIIQSAPIVPLQSVDATSDSVWDRLAACESGQHWNDNTGNGFYGGLQFTLGTWAGVGGVGNPANASKDEQIYRAKILESRRGFSPWPACGRKLGLL